MGSGKLIGDPDKKVGWVISNGAITTPKIADRAVTPDKLSGDVVTKMLYPMVENTRINLQHQINAFNAHGVALSNTFGPNPCIGISQKALSEAFRWLCEQVSEVAGKNILDVKFEVNPPVTSSLQADITITLVPPIGKIERIALYIDDVLVDTEHVAENYSFSTTLYKSSNVKVEYDYLGKHYTKQRLVQIGKSDAETWSYTGSGTVFLDVYRHRDCLVSYDDLMSMRQILVGMWGDYIFLVLDNSTGSKVGKITMSGFEIPFDKDTSLLEGYTVYTSKNRYINGTWPIAIGMRAA